MRVEDTVFCEVILIITRAMIDTIQHINKNNLKKINLLLLGTHGFANHLGCNNNESNKK